MIMMSLVKHTGIKNLKIKKIFIFVLLLSLFAQNAYAVVKVDDLCYKIGKTKIVKQNKYFCVKKENGLFWSKPVNNSKPAKNIKSIYDLSKDVSNTSYWAWKNANIQISNSKITGPKTNIYLSPEIKSLSIKDEYKVFDLVSKLYDKYYIPSVVSVIYYTVKDIPWAQNEFSKHSLFSEGNEASNGCAKSHCYGAQARIGKNREGLILIGLDSGISNYEVKTLDAHEFSHTIQSAAFFDTDKESGSNRGIKQYMPDWFVEGGASFSQASSFFYNDFNSYLEERKRIIYNLDKDKQINDDWIKNFLDPVNTSIWNNGNFVYDIGFLALEAMSAIKGPGIQIDIMLDIANGKSFEESFEYRFGVSWEKSIPLLSDYIYKSINNQQ